MQFKFRSLSFIILVLIFHVSLTTLHSQPIPNDSLYLGQKAPSNIPQLFLKGASERIVCSPDGKEIYFSGNNSLQYYKYSNNKWNGPYVLFTSSVGPALSPDGKILFFQQNKNNLLQSFYSVKCDTGWNKPLLFWNSTKNVHYLQLTKAGNYYATTNPLISLNGEFSKFIFNKSDTLLQSLGKPLNGYNGLDFFISRDETFIILVVRRDNGKGFGDLCVSYHKKDGGWTDPKNLGILINPSTNWQWGPYVTDDNKYLFYTSGVAGGNPSIYWVSAKVIDDIKKEVFNSKITK